jgi:hypothetical protein
LARSTQIWKLCFCTRKIWVAWSALFAYSITNFANWKTNSYVILMIWSRKASHLGNSETWRELWMPTKMCWTRSIHFMRQRLVHWSHNRHHLNLEFNFQHV